MSSNWLATNYTTIDPGTTSSQDCINPSSYHDHSNYPGKGQQDVENVDPDIPAERKPAKPPCWVMVSRIVGILGLCVWCGGRVCVCVCGVGGVVWVGMGVGVRVSMHACAVTALILDVYG